MNILTVAGTVLPTPNSYKVTLSDLDSEDTGRTEDGTLTRNRVRAGIAKIAVSWSALSTEDCARILNATAADSFSVEYFFGDMHSATMYAGDRETTLTAAREGQAVWEVSLTMIEF